MTNSKKIGVVFIAFIILSLIFLPVTYAKGGHSGGHSSHSSHTSSSSKTSTSTSSKSSGTTVKSSGTTSKFIKSPSGKTYTVPKNFTSKYNAENIKTEKVNSNPIYYTNYSSSNFFQPNFWTIMWGLNCMHHSSSSNNNSTSSDNVVPTGEIVEDTAASEQEIAKELEERGYTQEEINEILEEGRQAQEASKQQELEDQQAANSVNTFFIILSVILLILVAVLVIYKIAT